MYQLFLHVTYFVPLNRETLCRLSKHGSILNAANFLALVMHHANPGNPQKNLIKLFNRKLHHFIFIRFVKTGICLVFYLDI